MKKLDKIEYSSIVEHEELVRLIVQNPDQADQIIADMCQRNPENEESILLAADLIRHYQTGHTYLSSNLIDLMWNDIVKRSELIKSRPVLHFSMIYKIAASIIILAVLAIAIHGYTHKNSLRQIANEKIEMSDEAQIVISNGSVHKLKLNNSHIRYDSNGKEIVIEENNNQTEKLDNLTAETNAGYNMIVVPYGRRHSLTLSDGTEVQLNSGSKLVFPAKFSKSTREVYLKGEGYFNVTKDDKKPFVVNTDHIGVKVFGTQFNISAYEDEKEAIAVLVEGSVEVSTKSVFKNIRYRIKPGEGCFFSDNSSGLTVKNVNVIEYISWKNGLFQFSDQSLANIVQKVKKYYNKNIIIKDNDLARRLISGKLVLSLNFEETITLLTKTTRSHYTVQKDGTCLIMK